MTDDDLLLDCNQFLFGCYSKEEILKKLYEYGILKKAKEKGYSDFDIFLRHEGGKTYSIKVFGHKNKKRYVIGESILRESSITIKDKENPLCGKTFSMLIIIWILLQDPTGKFSASKPKLPGQKYPGLNAGRELMTMFINMMKTLNLEGIINKPEFIHNGIMYSKRFKYFNPEAEGRLRKIMDQFSYLSLSELSFKVLRGEIVDENKNPFFTFFQEEQVYPGCDELVQYFLSDYYKSKVEYFYKKAFFSLKTP